MSQVRLYLDEDAMRKSLVFGLRARNVDVLTATEADMINHADEAHLATASAASRALFTHNTSDFCALHQSWILQGVLMRALSWLRNNNTRLAKNCGG